MGSTSQTSNAQRTSRIPGFSVTHVQSSELAGLLIGVAGLLTLLSLISYTPYDPSFNTAAPAGADTRNWIGVAGAFFADALVQLFGWTAFLIPVGLVGIGIRWILGRPIGTPGTKAIGAFLLLVSITSLLALFPYTPLIQDVLGGGGLVGALSAHALVFVFNTAGAWIVLGSLLVVSLFFLSAFSFSQTGPLLKQLLAQLRQLGGRWRSWQSARWKAKFPRMPGTPGIRIPAFLQKTITQDAREIGKSGELARKSAPTSPVISRGVEEPEAGGWTKKLRSFPKGSGSSRQGFKLPEPSLLQPADAPERINEKELKTRAVQLIQKFEEFDVRGTVTQIHPGPVVTTFEFKPEAGIKYSRMTTLAEDLCLGLGAESILIERIPGKATVGIQVPNKHREIIHLRELVECRDFFASAAKLNLCLGKNINGVLRTSDLAQMPHMLIAGSTGAGKSVSINSMIMSLLFRLTPDELKLIMIDPKHLELSLYEGLPHLYTPIVTNPKHAANILKRVTMEMEDRLKKLAEQGVRSIEQYNRIFSKETTLSLFDENDQAARPLPYIVIVIDELADLMITEGRMVEESITRLAQMARAVGIHLILATQRPSVDIITGLIKANFPCRISFRVASKVDSRTVLDSNGAEALLGRGDMLFIPPGSARLVRLHGPLVTEPEIARVVDWWKDQAAPSYEKKLLEPVKKEEGSNGNAGGGMEESEEGQDEVYQEAVRLVVESRKASTSLLQRRLRLGYGRAARLIDMMQEDGIVGPPDGARPREVLKPANWLRDVEQQLR